MTNPPEYNLGAMLAIIEKSHKLNLVFLKADEPDIKSAIANSERYLKMIEKDKKEYGFNSLSSKG